MKKRIFRPKTGFFGQKKTTFLRHDREKLWKGKRTLFLNFGSFFWKKTDFRPVFRFSAKRKNGRFSVNSAGTGSVVIVGHFLVNRMVPTSFVKDGPKLGVLAMNTRPLPKMHIIPLYRMASYGTAWYCFASYDIA